MNNIWRNFIRPIFRGLYRNTQGLLGFLYDYRRFVLYSGWKENLYDSQIRNYNLAMAYHGLEKSLSYKKRNKKSGWSNARRVYERLKKAHETGHFGYHDIASSQVLSKFLTLPENIENKQSKEMLDFINDLGLVSDEDHGSINLSFEEITLGKLNKPEMFFLSRYSLREYSSNGKVDLRTVERVVRMAMKTPSVCNRQEWHVYHTDDRSIMDTTLSYQNGNKPFGNKIPNLFIVSVDLKAFFSGFEHYQHWIDGGLFSMSLIYALHSLGIASCPLNWSQTPKADKAIRKAIEIQDNHTIIMMIGFGYPDGKNKVCSSTRRPLEEVLTNLQNR
ncbi:Nitroreductase [Maribacter orientalis]|uniref:Nitroreductase n=1 Tax=Maribacter orientalis TaxID=228957 RepID=A0A1H7THL0_9FLAO|nr:nitroreductase family protein [Maribacter orientalis]SEL83969.1 Nitroreductase [Maribacter orientalis]